MKLSDAFPSQYLKAADVAEKPVLKKMDRTEYEMIGSDRKLILYFEGEEKGMVLNRTNANNIGDIYGDDTDTWRGQEIVLFQMFVDFQGKTVPSIRVRAPKRRPSNAAPAAAPAAVRPAGARRQAAEMDDEIPF